MEFDFVASLDKKFRVYKNRVHMMIPLCIRIRY